MKQTRFTGTVGRTMAQTRYNYHTVDTDPKDAPNVIYILLDDMGFAQLGCYGSSIETPNIDRLAREGLRYNNFHTTAVCSATRTSLLTGANHHAAGCASLIEMRTGCDNNLNGNLKPEYATIAEILKTYGYATFCTGKFLSDNGASAEGGIDGRFNAMRGQDVTVRAEGEVDYAYEHLDEIGTELAFNHYPTGWANCGNTPFQWYKIWTHEGGIKDPLIIRYPKGIEKAGEVRGQYHHVTDITPTILDIIGVEKPDVIKGVPQKRNGFPFIQLIPCMDEQTRADGDKHNQYAVDPQQYGKFLNELFDLWYEDFEKGVQMDIRMFSNLAQMAAGYPPEECGMNGCCTCYFVVEGDGSVYPCDFYCLDEWRLGTLQQSFGELLVSDRARAFLESSNQMADKCRSCPHVSLCRGGCRRWREMTGDGALGLNYLCPAYEIFFSHCSQRIERLGQLILETYGPYREDR